MTPYPHLFTPIKIGGQLIKNRIFSAPTGLMSYTARGHLTTENMAYYALKAKGGCGVSTPAWPASAVIKKSAAPLMAPATIYCLPGKRSWRCPRS